MATCVNCKRSEPTISGYLGLCLDCIRNDWENVKPRVKEVHSKAREKFGLPSFPPGLEPRTLKGSATRCCSRCVNKCRISPGEQGYCGMRKNTDGRLVDISQGSLDWYFDPLPTNCVAEWVCPGRLAYGHKNLAVFYRACSFDCLFCQNWHFKYGGGREVTPKELAGNIDRETFCICYFGGDPTPQIQHAIETSEIAIKKGIRICWETNGSMNPKILNKVAELSFESGGCIKFDLKTWDERLNIALCGVSNRQTIENFARIAERWVRRPISTRSSSSPFLIASTLLVPGYVDTQEVGNIARFISELNSEIPYSLLAFYPCFLMSDLPTTSRKQAETAFKVAKEEGLKNVHIGNLHLLS